MTFTKTHPPIEIATQGKLDKGTILGFAEFTDFMSYSVGSCDLRAELVQESFVETFKDGSMLFFVATSGFNCLNLATFEAFVVSPFVNAFTATTTGKIEVPKGRKHK